MGSSTSFPFGNQNAPRVAEGAATEDTLAALRDRVPVPTANGRLPVDIDGATISGSFTTQPSVASTENVPPGPLEANEWWEGAWEDVLNFSAIQIGIFTDAGSTVGGAVLEFSADGVEIIRAVPTTILANIQAYFHLAPQARFVRIRYMNGPVAQTFLRVSVLYSYNTPAEVVQPIGAGLTDLNVSTVVRAALASRIMTGPSTGAYLPVGNDGTGRLLVSDGKSQQLTDAQLRAAPVPVSGTVAVSNPTPQGLTDAELRSAPVPVAVAAGTTKTDKFDYGVRSDNLFVYRGAAAIGSLDTDAVWSVTKYDYDASNRLRQIDRRENLSWAGRTSPSIAWAF